MVSARSPASTLGSSEGLRGSTDTFMQAVVLKATARKGATSPPAPPAPVTVAARVTASPSPSSSTSVPGGAPPGSSSRKRAWPRLTPRTSATCTSSVSSAQ